MKAVKPQRFTLTLLPRDLTGLLALWIIWRFNGKMLENLKGMFYIRIYYKGNYMKLGQWIWYKNVDCSKSIGSIKESDKPEIPAIHLRILVDFGYIYASGLRKGGCCLQPFFYDRTFMTLGTQIQTDKHLDRFVRTILRHDINASCFNFFTRRTKNFKFAHAHCTHLQVTQAKHKSKLAKECNFPMCR